VSVAAFIAEGAQAWSCRAAAINARAANPGRANHRYPSHISVHQDRPPTQLLPPSFTAGDAPASQAALPPSGGSGRTHANVWIPAAAKGTPTG
jgi:hypothetical protein